MHAQGLLSSVFPCYSPMFPSSCKTVSKQKLRQSISLDPALMRHYGTEVEETADKGDFTWNSVSGRTVGLKPVPLQSLSELERVRLQDVAFSRLLQDCDLGCQITFPKDCHKRKKSLRRKLDSLSKEKSKDKDTLPQAFGIALSQVISNDCAHKQRHEHQREGHRDPSDLMLSFLQLTSASKRANNNKDLSSSNSSLSSTSETPNDSPLPSTPEAAPRTRRRGGVSVDCITDLDDNQSRLLEALQLSLPAEAAGNRNKRRDKKLSLNPIYRQVPRVVDNCCQHLEKYGLQTVGIFRVGSSKKRVRQLREEFDQGLDVHLDEEHSVHDVAALLKEFLRDMPDPLLTRELYTAFINTMMLDWSDQEVALQLLMYLLPPCNSDTLQRLLHFLSTVAAHAQDSFDSDGQENSGNKMTPLNLATIFGPNLLRKQKNSDKEFVVQSFARAEESTAIISVVQRMISTHETLFMVPADLQNEVLMSLLETDPDVVDYLLRRKDSQYSSPGSLKTEESFSLSDDRRLSSDSNKVSSGEVSPYDNNSPVLSDRLLYKCQGDSSPDSSSDRLFKLRAQYKHSGHSKDRPGDTCTSPTIEDHNDSFWGSWHVSQDFVDQHSFTGSHGNVSESQCYGRSEGLNSHQSHSQLSLRRARTSPAVPAHRTHLPVTRSSSTPQERRGGQRKPDSSLLQRLHSLWGAFSSEDIAGRERHPDSAPFKGGTDPQYTEHLRERRMSNSTPSLVMHQPEGLSPQVPEQPLQRSSPTSHTVDPAAVSGAGERTGLDTDQCQSEKWHIWQLRSTVNADILTETLV